MLVSSEPQNPDDSPFCRPPQAHRRYAAGRTPTGGPSSEAVLPFLLKFLTTGFYSGYSPVAPGTAGSLVALILYLIPSFDRPHIIGLIIVLGFLIGVYGGTRLERTMGHDPTVFVIDEMVGMWISLFLLPRTTLVVVIAFLTFRALDVIKPQPARLFQRRGGGFSIMMDDVVAGIYTNLSIQLGLLLFSFL